MDAVQPAEASPTPEQLIAELEALRRSVIAMAGPTLEHFGADAAADPSLANLAQYLAIRRTDLRTLQRQLMWHGLSSLGRLESRVLPTLDATLAALSALAGRPPLMPPPTETAFFAGQGRLEAATDRLFGPRPPHRRTRIMVTLPSEAATDAALISDFARRGMDVARINCAHDCEEDWRAMIRHVRRAGQQSGRPLRVLMDIAGPKIRTESVAALKHRARLEPGDHLRLIAAGDPRPDDGAAVSASVSLPQMVTRLVVGDRVRYDDGALEGVVVGRTEGEAVIRVVAARGGGVKLKAHKGLNLPDTTLDLSPLTDKDRVDLKVVAECADLLGYSFVSHPEDIDDLERALAEHPVREQPLGLVAKIERPEAITNLPRLIARAAGRRPFSIMIARGDLAAEIGFERLAEMQEEILWICEAAGVPTIWATQVLENLIVEGIPSRAEMTDAAMSARAECVMLNKGPGLPAAIDVLDHLLARMEDDSFKKTPTLRPLKS